MVLIKEYRIVMPLSVEEYRIGHLWTVSSFSASQTGGGDGVEVLKNEPFSSKPLLGAKYSTGQYTHKRFYGAKKVGGLLSKLLPQSALVAEEESWNAYPYCRTIITNQFLGPSFYLKIESLYLDGNCSQRNPHQLPEDVLRNHLEVVTIDIASDLEDPHDYRRKYDPCHFKSLKTGRGPLSPGWSEVKNQSEPGSNSKVKTKVPTMTCYKLVTVQFKWFGLQRLVESKIHNMQKRLFTLFNRQVFCCMDKWWGMTMGEIRDWEQESRKELEVRRKEQNVRGLRAE